MIISISNATQETLIIEVVLVAVLLLSIRLRKTLSFFSLETTTELRGLAILMVVFAHIGYFLVSDHRFLVPLSNYGGVGVDLFFLLSGYGLVASALRKPVSVGNFYLKRLMRVYVPVMITVVLFFCLDFFWLHKMYPAKTIIESLLGFFPNADIYADLNSPLWYITPLLAYYLLFPLIFWRRFPLVSALAMAVIGWWGVNYVGNLDVFFEVVFKLYRLHFVAFPLGMALAAIINQPPRYGDQLVKRITPWFQKKYISTMSRWVLIAIGAYIFIYLHYHPTVGQSWKREELASLITVGSIMLVFLFKKINFKILYWLGLFSFEVYLLHWPLLYGYNFLYGKVPASLATILYVAILLGLGYMYHHIIAKIFSVKFKPAATRTLS